MAEPRFGFYRGDSINALMEIVVRVQGEVTIPPPTKDAALKADIAQREHFADNEEVGGTPVSAGKRLSALRAASRRKGVA